MVDLTEPVDFDTAIDKLSSKELEETHLTSAQLRARGADINDRAFFSSRVSNAVILDAFKKSVDEIVKGKSNFVHQKGEVLKVLDSLGYQAEPRKAGAIEDLRSNQRLNLILNTNTAMVRGYGQYQEGMHPDVLTAFPAQELIRIGYRKVPRLWREIWDNARLLLGDSTAALPSSVRLAAVKGDPIWTQISDFGLPWPPFRFNSGMGLADIDYDEAIDLGLVKETPTAGGLKLPTLTPLKPVDLNRNILPMNKGLAASVEGMDTDLLSVLLQSLVGFSLVGTEIALTDDDSTQNRSVSEVWEALAA